jgi:hypothetical protein
MTTHLITPIEIALSMGKLILFTIALAMSKPQINEELTRKVFIGIFLFAFACWLYQQIENKLFFDSVSRQAQETIRENKKLSCDLNPKNNPDCNYKP